MQRQEQGQGLGVGREGPGQGQEVGGPGRAGRVAGRAGRSRWAPAAAGPQPALPLPALPQPSVRTQVSVFWLWGARDRAAGPAGAPRHLERGWRVAVVAAASGRGGSRCGITPGSGGRAPTDPVPVSPPSAGAAPVCCHLPGWAALPGCWEFSVPSSQPWELC